MTPSDELVGRLRDELQLDLPDGARLERTRAGRWQKSTGAWSWFVVDGDGREPVPGIGSPYTVTWLLRYKRLAASSVRGVSIEIGPA